MAAAVAGPVKLSPVPKPATVILPVQTRIGVPKSVIVPSNSLSTLRISTASITTTTEPFSTAELDAVHKLALAQLQARVSNPLSSSASVSAPSLFHLGKSDLDSISRRLPPADHSCDQLVTGLRIAWWMGYCIALCESKSESERVAGKGDNEQKQKQTALLGLAHWYLARKSLLCDVHSAVDRLPEPMREDYDTKRAEEYGKQRHWARIKLSECMASEMKDNATKPLLHYYKKLILLRNRVLTRVPLIS